MRKWFEVVLFHQGNEVYKDIVRSKESRTAITNVLINKYNGEISRAEVQEVKAFSKIEKIED